MPQSAGAIIYRARADLALVDLLIWVVSLTRDEVDGLMAGLLTSVNAPTGTKRLRRWLERDPDGLSRWYEYGLRQNWRQVAHHVRERYT